ncbi:MAG TPA: HAMP domain-containing sensor histidine kinase [Verrucomicrobiae bacterium]|nr:HAMP domain-containing sensor histidine kinase [Verrucomicrobiae bacterium]
MIRSSLPWMARASWTGGAFGVASAAVLIALIGLTGLPATVAALMIIAVGYLGGVLVAARTRLREAVRYILRLRSELRLTQDYLMEQGSSRSLGVWLEAAGATFKGPLTTLQSEARSLAADTTLPENVRAAAKAIVERANAFAEAMKPITTYSLATPSRAPFNLNIVLREAIDLCRHRAEEKKIAFKEFYGDLPPVFGPGTRTQTALLNVVVNAVESMPFGGGTIEIKTWHEGSKVIARISDVGIGIRPEHLAKVFDPFFTTKPDKGGAGLGLWETRDTLDRLGATIDIESTPHKGTAVIMSFPQAAPLSTGREGTIHPQEVPRNTADDRRAIA